MHEYTHTQTNPCTYVYTLRSTHMYMRPRARVKSHTSALTARAQLRCQLLKTAKAQSVPHQPFSSNMSTSVLAHIKFAKTHMNKFNHHRCFVSFIRHMRTATPSANVHETHINRLFFKHILTNHAICTAVPRSSRLCLG